MQALLPDDYYQQIHFCEGLFYQHKAVNVFIVRISGWVTRVLCVTEFFSSCNNHMWSCGLYQIII